MSSMLISAFSQSGYTLQLNVQHGMLLLIRPPWSYSNGLFPRFCHYYEVISDFEA